MANEYSDGYLKYKSVDIYFTYSFLLGFNKSYCEIVERLKELEWKEGAPSDRMGLAPFLDIVRSKKENGEIRYLPALFYKDVIESSSEPPYPQLYYKGKTVDGETITEDFPVRVDATARIFDNGSGCITFKISKEKGDNEHIGLREIHQIFSFSNRLSEKEQDYSQLKLKGKQAAQNLYDIFILNLGTLIKKINEKDKKILSYFTWIEK